MSMLLHTIARLHPKPAVGLSLAGLLLWAPIGSCARPAAPPASAGGSPAAAAAHAVLLVVNKADDTVALVDPASGRVDTTLGVGQGPHEIAVSPDGRLAYVSNYGVRDEPGRSISVLDIAARRVLSTIPLEDPELFQRPHGLAMTGDARGLFVTVESNRAVLELDLASERIARILPTEQKVSHMAALAPDGKWLYVTNLGSATLTVIRLSDGVSRLVATGKGPEGLAVSPDGRFVWVANREDGTVQVLDAATDSTVDTIAVGGLPIRVAFSPDGERVLVSCAQGNEVVVLDAHRRRLRARIPTGEMPIGLVVEPDGRHFWVSESRRDRVTRYDLRTLRATIHVIPGREPDGLGWARPSAVPPAAAPR